VALTDSDFQPPAELRTAEFLLRPIRASDAERDYAAVMESREFLRPWEQSGWPADDFTVEANRQDLAKLERRHADGESFTYTVLDPTETDSLGCVYLFPTSAPISARPQISAIDNEAWSAYEAAIYYWVRTSRLADGLDQRLLAALGPWLAQDWDIAQALVITNEQVPHQVALFEDSGRRLRFRLTFPKEPGNSLAYA
jgi:hypothetical protein